MSFIKTASTALALCLSTAASAYELVMVEQPGCYACLQWDKEIAHIYPNTTEGKFAPLKRVMLNESGDKIDLERRVNYTPTFVLVDENQEIARLEGYAGEDFFWFLLSEMLKSNSDYTGEE